MRTGMVLMARGSVVIGSLVSAAAVPASSMPTKANSAIWKPARKPMKPFGKIPPSFQRLATAACAPVGSRKETATMTTPTTISATIATILTIANQNSVSPNAFTASRFRPSSSPTVSSAGIHAGRSAHQNRT